MRITPRDRAIIRAVYQFRLLSAHQIEALLFQSEKPNGKRTVCQRRLQLLFHHGFLDRLPTPVMLGEGRQPYVYVLDKKGADLLANEMDMDRAELGWKPKYNALSPSFINHSLLVNDVLLVFTLLAEAGHWKLKQWLSDRDFSTAAYQDKVPYRTQGMHKMRIFPDGYFRLSLPDVEQDTHFFLEVDRSSENNQTWQDKMKAYYQFRQNGFSERYYETKNFRLLAVVNSPNRLVNLKRTTERAGGDHYFWFTTTDTFDIWQPEKLLTAEWQIATRDELRPLFSE